MKSRHVSYLLVMTVTLIPVSLVFAHGPNPGILSGNSMGSRDYDTLGDMIDDEKMTNANDYTKNGFDNISNPYDLDGGESIPYYHQPNDYQRDAERLKRQILERSTDF